MDAAHLQARIDAIPWYHEFDFGNGLRARSSTPDVAAHQRTWSFIEGELDKVDFRGKGVLDIGCWDGYWSFAAERRGAASVLATDDFSQNWSDDAGILLAKELLGSRVEVDLKRSVHDLAGLNRTFDIVLFLGVYYHLFDPFHALAQIRHCCHPGTVVLIEGGIAGGLQDSGVLFDPRQGHAKYLPAAGTVEHLARATYFHINSFSALDFRAGFWREALRALGPRWRWRYLCSALFGTREQAGAAAACVRYGRRGFWACTPFEGVNPSHSYRPPFGLHRYDPRFAEAGRRHRAA